MADVFVRDTHLTDIVRLAQNLREADRAEIRAYGHTDVLKQLTRSAAHSMLCWTAFIDGEVAAVLGVAPMSVMAGIGSPWMMGTPVLDAHSRVLVRETPRYIDQMLVAFPHLVNYVHAENTTSIRWLRRLGFFVDTPQLYGPLDAPFCKFEMKVGTQNL